MRENYGYHLFYQMIIHICRYVQLPIYHDISNLSYDDQYLHMSLSHGKLKIVRFVCYLSMMIHNWRGCLCIVKWGHLIHSFYVCFIEFHTSVVVCEMTAGNMAHVKFHIYALLIYNEEEWCGCTFVVKSPLPFLLPLLGSVHPLIGLMRTSDILPPTMSDYILLQAKILVTTSVFRLNMWCYFVHQICDVQSLLLDGWGLWPLSAPLTSEPINLFLFLFNSEKF